MAVALDEDLAELYTKGAYIWLRDDEEVWVDAKILSRDGNTLRIERKNGKEELHDISDPAAFPPVKNPSNVVSEVFDLIELSHLHEPGVLRTLRHRFVEKKEIYTYCGIALLAMNPYDDMDHIYGVDKMKIYRQDHLGEADPHVYAVAQRALKQLTEGNGKDQSIVVSGESGAGKTESAKRVMKYFAWYGGKSSAAVEEDMSRKVLASNHVLEAFGNAKTTRNDNSSRFGKYTEIQFCRSGTYNWHIVGATIRTFLLEKSRVVSQADVERAYHIMYYLCTGATEAGDDDSYDLVGDGGGESDNGNESDDSEHDEKTLESSFLRGLRLGPPEDFHYTNQGGEEALDSRDTDKEWETFENSLIFMEYLGISKDQQMDIFRVMAAILHLGNVSVESLNDSEESFIDAEDEHVSIAAGLMQVDPELLSRAITHRTVIAGGESIETPQTMENAKAGRDALSKHLYSQIFDWLIKAMNIALATEGKKETSFIGVLDIYGFETFQINSYEQFCINYANEKLQLQFNHHVFQLEQEEYVREGIEWSFVNYYDNRPCIELIEGPRGMLALLDDECRKPKGSDTNWAIQVLKSLESSHHLRKASPQLGENSAFIVVHYAANVCYQVAGFLQKNKDLILEDHRSLLRASRNNLMQEIFSPPEKKPRKEVLKERRLSRRELQQTTVGSAFRDSLALLMDTLNSTYPHYIRCIKPNDEKKPFKQNNSRTIEQLRACGVLETIRISASGYPQRYAYAEFNTKYSSLVPRNAIGKWKALDVNFVNPSLALTERDAEYYDQLWAYVHKEKDGALPTAKAVPFFKLSDLDEEQLASIWSLSASSTGAKSLSKREFLKACKYIALAQVGDDVTEENLKKKTMIPSFGRGIPPERHGSVLAPRRASVGARRLNSTANLAQRERLKTEAMMESLAKRISPAKYQFGKTKIYFRAGQTALLEKMKVEKETKSAIKVQAAIRGWITHRQYKRKLRAAIVFQKYVRGWIDRKYVRYLRQEASALKIQTFYRRYVARKKFLLLRQAIFSLQCYARGFLARGQTEGFFKEKAAHIIQNAWRSYITRKHFKSKMKQVLLLQACARRWLAKRRVDALRKEKNDPIRLHSRIQDLVQQLKTRPDSQDVEALRQRVAELELQLGDKDAELKQFQTEKQERIKELKKTSLELKSENGELRETVEDSMEEISSLRQQLESLTSETTTKISDMEANIQKKTELVKKQKVELKQLRSNMEQAEAEKSTHTLVSAGDMEKLRRQLQQARDGYSAEKEKADQLSEEVNATATRERDAVEAATIAKEEAQRLKQRIQTIKEQREADDVELRALRRMQNLQAHDGPSSDELEKALSHAHAKITKLEVQLEGMKGDEFQNHHKRQVDNLKEQIRGLASGTLVEQQKEIIDALKMEVNELRSQLSQKGIELQSLYTKMDSTMFRPRGYTNSSEPGLRRPAKPPPLRQGTMTRKNTLRRKPSDIENNYNNMNQRAQQKPRSTSFWDRVGAMLDSI
eukprot:m.139453 g.139453  ORF g.139453 m.139453 type:complete len:1495 (-) comp14800_c0_seq1:163-4647(-)